MPTILSGQAEVWWDSQGEGSPILLINGLSSPSAVWFRLAPALAARHRVITFDNLGTGRTGTPPGPYTMAMLADAAAAVIDAAGEQSVHVLGISLGGLIAQELAVEHPHLVSSLTLVSTHAGAPHMTSDQDSLDAIARAADLPAEDRTRYLAELVYADTTPPERVAEDLAVRAQHPTSDEGYRNQHAATVTWERLSELHTIACPTLVLHGDQDRLVSVANAQQLAKHVPAAQLTVLANSGHQLFTDQPQTGADTVLSFLASVDEAPMTISSDNGVIDPQSLAGRLADLAQAEPDRLAVTCGEHSITRGELQQASNRLARAYQALGVTRDSFVTIGLPNGIEFITAVMAVWKCGATPQPISSALPGREVATIIELASPSLVVGVAEKDAQGFPAIPQGFRPSIEFPDTPFDMGPASALKAPTSGGSTGRPKLIVAAEPATADAVVPMGRMVGMTDDDTVLITGPLYHNGPFTLSFCSLALGGHTVLMPRFDAAEALRLVEEQRVNWMWVVPTMMARIWRLPVSDREVFDLSSLRVVMHMAAPCPEWLKSAWIDWLGADHIWELYAGTEMQSATLITGSEWLAHPGSVGRPVTGEMVVLDSHGSPLPTREVGEIWMRRGEGIADSYRYVGAEPQSLDGGWETIGDMGWMDADGYVYLADRKADMIVVGGANVYPAEIEGALLEHPHVTSAVVIGKAHEDLGRVPHGLVELDEDLSDDELRSHLAERIAAYKIPRSFERVTETLRDDAGKVRRSALVAAREASAD